MPMFRICRVLCVLGFVAASLCVNEFDYNWNYADYNNEISQDQQDGEFLSFHSFVPCFVLTVASL